MLEISPNATKTMAVLRVMTMPFMPTYIASRRVPVRTSSSSMTSEMSMLSIRKMPAKPTPIRTAAATVVVRSVTNHRGTIPMATVA